MNNATVNKQMIIRLNRIAGQISGVKRMIEDERDCADIIMQVTAIRAAVGKLGMAMMEVHLHDCLKRASKSSGSKYRQAISRTMKLMLK